MGYLLRVTPPAAIADLASKFDHKLFNTIQVLLDMEGESEENIIRLKQALKPLRHGGFGLTSAVHTSPIAYLSSVASAAAVPVFSEFASAQSQLPNDCPLYQHLSQCIQMITHNTPSSRNLLPRNAASFFTHFTSAQTSTLQHDLNTRAADNQFNKALDEAVQNNNLIELARLLCTSSPHASDWKEAIPTNKDTTLTNTQYQIAARLNLGIPMRSQCPDCHGCHVKNALKNDPYHYLSCPAHRRREITFRHNLVLQVVHRYINYVGGVAVKEPHDLHDADGRRPDLQLILRDLHALCDVRISHPLCPTHVSSAATQQLAVAMLGERIKTNKYKSTAEQHEAKFIPFVMESTGGIGPESAKLLDQIILASRDHNTLWPHEVVSQELRGAVAVAVQKGNAMTMIAGRNLAIGRAAACPAA
jgi:hypothetical protein